MKKQINLSWKASKNRKKQKKYLLKAPIHIRHKIISCHLSKELREKYKRRAIPLRKNDVVKVMKGEFDKKQGKVVNIDAKNYKIFVEGIQRTKKDGTKINVPIHSSNLQIVTLDLEDKKRNEKLNMKIAKEK